MAAYHYFKMLKIGQSFAFWSSSLSSFSLFKPVIESVYVFTLKCLCGKSQQSLNFICRKLHYIVSVVYWHCLGFRKPWRFCGVNKRSNHLPSSCFIHDMRMRWCLHCGQFCFNMTFTNSHQLIQETAGDYKPRFFEGSFIPLCILLHGA